MGHFGILTLSGCRAAYHDIKIKNEPFFTESIYTLGKHDKKTHYSHEPVDGIHFDQVMYDDEEVSKSPSSGGDSVILTPVHKIALYKGCIGASKSELRYFIIQPHEFSDISHLFVELDKRFCHNLKIAFNPLMGDSAMALAKAELQFLYLKAVDSLFETAERLLYGHQVI